MALVMVKSTMDERAEDGKKARRQRSETTRWCCLRKDKKWAVDNKPHRMTCLKPARFARVPTTSQKKNYEFNFASTSVYARLYTELFQHLVLYIME